MNKKKPSGMEGSPNNCMDVALQMVTAAIGQNLTPTGIE
jgi:hypothetical protein